MYRKLTITLPQEVIQILEKNSPKGQRSGFIADAIEEKIYRENTKMAISKLNPWEKLLETRKGLPKFSTDEILEMIEKGRRY